MHDLPFSEKTLMLSLNTETKIPNVVSTMFPERTVQQYQCYCHETGFAPMCCTTLCRILNICSASVCKSLQGLDYVSAESAKAFDPLAYVIDKLGENYGKGLSWAKDQSEKLKMAKRHLKGDFKVGIQFNTINVEFSSVILCIKTGLRCIFIVVFFLPVISSSLEDIVCFSILFLFWIIFYPFQLFSDISRKKCKVDFLCYLTSYRITMNRYTPLLLI